MFAIVRDAQGSTHLNAIVSGLKNVHIFEGDVTDYRSLEVRTFNMPTAPAFILSRASMSAQRAAKQVRDVTGGTLDYLIHVAGRTDPETLYQALDD